MSVVSLGAPSSIPRDEGLDEVQVKQWFYFGLSLATLLPQPAGAPFLRAVLQTIDEIQYHFASSTERSIKSMRARPQPGATGDFVSNVVPVLQRINGKVLYEYLLTPPIAHALSGAQVILGLCELLNKVYRKLAECATMDSTTPAIREALGRVDEKLEELFLAPASKHAEGVAKGALRQSLAKLDPLVGRLWGQSGNTPGAEDQQVAAEL